MLEFLGFGKSKHEPSETVFAVSNTPDAEPSPVQRDKVRVTLQTLLKRHGIPPSWLAVELLAHSSAVSAHGPAPWVVQVTVLQWHTGFGQYLVALQRELLDALKRFDPAGHPMLYAVHWVYAPNCGCPYTALPSAAFWDASVAELEGKPAKPSKTAKAAMPPPCEVDDDGFAATQMREDN